MADDVLARARAVCLALPEATEVTNDVGTEFKVRRRTFVYVFAIVDPNGREITMMACRADPDEREAVLASGHPFFAPRGTDRLGVVLEDTTDWDELAELMTTSYLLVAPAKLAALVEPP